MLQTFLPLFFMTFGICLFIVLMQFLWKYIDDMVGKGIDIAVLAEMFMYAALSLVPMALPLAVLLASLMTFGNLGETVGAFGDEIGRNFINPHHASLDYHLGFSECWHFLLSK